MLLDRRTIFVKERVAVFKIRDTYDLLDPESGQTVGIAKEETTGWARWLRLVLKKAYLPARVNVYEREDLPPVVTLRKKPGFPHTTVIVRNGRGQDVGSLKSKFFTLGGAFRVYDATGNECAEVKGDWKGWNFKLLDMSGQELGVITKKWAGIGRELFTNADRYVISLSEQAAPTPDRAALLLGAALAVDMVFKERQD
ncbi:MAG: phospholipid scramblase-related protein [Candidatus Eisenbacteria bacterium]